ncbi:MAG: ATP-binding cassette domain-containing protein [Saprospiraceae bacterium]|nr:ATP-binding cassette domain-containing protein [Saprospiraceae bacterium]
MAILSLQGVTKRYRDLIAVNDVTFDVPQGTLFGLLGPNGAGKTSLIRIITTITGADAGQVFFNSAPLNSRHPEQIGYLPEERGLYRKMKVGEHLMYLAQLKGLSKTEARARITSMMQKFEITDWWGKKVEELSKGMQQKIQFIATIVHRPKLIILDEPFSGLDPINTNLIKDEIFALNREGTSIIFSTHRMEQVEEICEWIVLINKGQNVLHGRVADIKEQNKEGIYRIGFRGKLPDDLSGHFTVISDTDNELLVKADHGMSPNALLRELLDRQFIIEAFEEVKPSLNEIFIKTVNGQARA